MVVFAKIGFHEGYTEKENIHVSAGKNIVGVEALIPLIHYSEVNPPVATPFYSTLIKKKIKFFSYIRNF